MSNPFEIKEVQELSKSISDVGKTTKAFENQKSEVKSPRHIDTINEGLAGQTYPGTNVEYRKHIFKISGEKVEGVFPKFDSQFDTCLPSNLRRASDTEQFRYCTERLQQKIERDPDFASCFTSRQIEQIKDGAPRIAGLTWHHNEIPGRMQLVDAHDHQVCRHTGGRSIWGGGSSYR